MVISERVDRVREVTRGYGKEGNSRPGDYLDAFRAFIHGNLNRIPALLIVTQRPRDLTRKSLRELELTLDEAGDSEQALRTAWREQKNEDIAASIIGYIRQLAFDDASFKADGGFTRLNKIFGGTLEALLGELTDEVWKDAG